MALALRCVIPTAWDREVVRRCVEVESKGGGGGCLPIWVPHEPSPFRTRKRKGEGISLAG